MLTRLSFAYYLNKYTTIKEQKVLQFAILMSKLNKKNIFNLTHTGSQNGVGR
ncbi:hypothetical protein M23134_04450 [Microscilla marina ATCC 23134]|uniref:Uncharacterized protein n=1 Tax=Microscilla marina ATCC 23134 TaxID=313606 RepID=A1ZM71_MICM2|nr:hypothetical protein M23134_04450 [Microscilla marina ATCC 23134]